MSTGIMNTKTGDRIGVYQFKDRKKPRLCVVKGNAIVSYAVFNSTEAADEFMKELVELLNVKRKADDNFGTKEN